jgi:putative ABC transport system permease protein
MMKDGQKGSDGRTGKTFRNLLVVAELALSLVLIVGAGLLLRSLGNLINVNPGFDPHSVTTVNISALGKRFNDTETAIEFFRQVIDRTDNLPGVQSAGMVNILPISGGFDQRGFHIQDRPLANVTEAPSIGRYVISPNYLKTFRIPLIRGRGFSDKDNLKSPQVALVNETAAREQWPNENPIGKQVQLGDREDSQPWITIVGVVGDVHHYGLDRAPSMQIYLPFAQDGNSDMTMVVRSNVAAGPMAAAIRQAVSSVEKGQLVYGENSMEFIVASSLSQRKFTLGLLGAFAGLALLLAIVGVYGVMAYTVASRSREFGIRLALGARSFDVNWMVLRWSLRLIGLGLGAGLIASIMISRLMTSLLFEVQPTDTKAIAAAAVVLVVTGALASYLPARRAGRVDPISALRAE